MAFKTLSMRNRKVSDKGRSQMQSNPQYGQEMHHTMAPTNNAWPAAGPTNHQMQSLGTGNVTSREELRTQMKRALGEMILTIKYKFNMCDKACSDEDDLDWHLRKHHSTKSESVHSCNLCDMIITGENSLERLIKSDLDQHIKEQHTH